MPILIVEKGPERGQTVDLQAGCRWVFGRDESCDFTTEDVSCSRRHFGIAEKNGRFIVKDLKSTHGLSVNGTNVEMHELKDGDTIVAGETVLTFGVDKSTGSGRGLVGKTIAGYQIFERIGRGGMGTVFRAKQVALDRDVALKVLSARYSDDKVFINRFFKEAQAAARLNNPNVVQVFDVREEKGLYLISLEMMDGGTVQELATKEGKLPIDRVLRIAREATKGLAYAEKKNIVHGDIKPDNLMMNADGHIKISDLGLARDIGEMAHQGEEGVFGTPHFISPEQAQGKAVDSRSDIYSLGATIYRLIAGSTPFSGTSVREIIMKQINDEPTPLNEVREDCPADLADLVSVMMAKDAGDRFESAEALLSAVESLGDTGSLASAGSGKKVGIIAALVVILGVAGFFMFGNKEKDKPVQPEKPRSNSPTAEELAQQAADEKRRMEVEVKGLRVTAELFQAELVKNGKLDDVDSLKELISKFETAVAAGPETDEAADIQTKIGELQRKIKTLTEQAAEAKAAAAAKRAEYDKNFTALSESITKSLGEDSFAKALADFGAAEASLKESHRAAELPALKLKIMDAVEKSCRDFEAEVNKKVVASDFEGARSLVADFKKRLTSGGDVEALPEDLKKYLPRIDAQDKSIDGREAAKKDADRKLDQSTVYSTLFPYYRDFAKSFDLDAKNTRIKNLSQALQTEVFRKRLNRIEKALGESIALRDLVISKVTESPGSIETNSGSREIPSGKIVSADKKNIVVEKRSGKKESVAWAGLDAKTLYKSLFKRLDVSTKQRLDLASWLIECQMHEEAKEVLDGLTGRVMDASDNSGVTHDRLMKDLEREMKATSLLMEALDAREKATTESTRGHWMRAKQKLELFSSKYRDTRIYLISSDGSSPLE